MDKPGRTAPSSRAILAIGLAIAVFGFQAARPEPVRAEWAATLDIAFAVTDLVGDGLGRVTSDDGYIDCSTNGDTRSGDCSEIYSGIADFITEITITLYIDPAVESFACTDVDVNCGSRDQTLTRTVTFFRGGDDDKTIRPSFTWSNVRIRGSIDGPGSVDTGGGLSCDPGTATFCRMYRYGRTITWTAIPAAGSNFSYWTGGPCGADPRSTTCTFTATGTFDSTAVFGKWKLTVKSDGKGTTCVVGQADLCAGANASKSKWLDAGQTIGVTASPASGLRFDRWNNTKCAGQDKSCLFVLTGNVTVTAFYELIPAPTRTPTSTAKPTPKPTPKPTSKPSAAPTIPPAASQGPAASLAPTLEPSTSPEPIDTPEPVGSPPPVAFTTAAPSVAASSPDASAAPVPAASPGDELPILGVLVTGLGIGLGMGLLLALAFLLGRRGRSRSPTSE